MPAAAPPPLVPCPKDAQQSAWVHDVRIQTTTRLTTTGGTVWDAARRASTFLEALPPSAGLQRQGLQVLELGAGCGLLGLTLARNLPPGATVVLTEQVEGGALDHLAANVAANQSLPGCTGARAAACDWRLVATHGESPQQPDEQPGQPAQQQGGQEVQQGQAHQQQATHAESLQEEATGGGLTPQDEAPPVRPHSSQQLPLVAPASAAAAAGGSPQQPSGACRGCGRRAGAPTRWLAHHHVGPACWNYNTGLLPPTSLQATTPHHSPSSPAAAAAAAAVTESQPAVDSAAPTPNGPADPPQSGAVCSSSSSSGRGEVPCGSLAAGCPACDLLGAGWNLVVGSDLVYNSAGTHWLPGLLARLICPTTLVYYVHTKHRFDALDLELVEQLAAAGLALQEVWEPGAGAPPDSPPPLTTLFPDMRVAVYHIFPAPSSQGCGQ